MSDQSPSPFSIERHDGEVNLTFFYLFDGP
jgi:hypothetical protein